MSYGYYPLYVGSGQSAAATPGIVATTTTINTPNVTILNYPIPAIVATTTTINTPTLTQGQSVSTSVVLTTTSINTPTLRAGSGVTSPVIRTTTTIGTPLVLTTSVTVFRGPSRSRGLGRGERSGLWRRHHWPEGITVLKEGAFYRSVQNPAPEEIDAATEVYLGGREYTVTLAEATALIQAGYGAYLFSA